MQDLRRQNLELQRSINLLQEQIEKQKEINGQHEQEISTLLNFNQRLLQIIDKEMNNANKDNCSLQPISERSERDSDLIAPGGPCLLKPRKFDITTKSERGYPTTQSLIDRPHLSGNKLDLFKKQVQKSEINYDQYDQRESTSNKAPSGKDRNNFKPSLQQSNKVKEQMSKQIKDLRNFRKQTSQFYESKIKQVKALGSKITQYEPLQQLSQISDKLNLSPSTFSLLRKVVEKESQ